MSKVNSVFLFFIRGDSDYSLANIFIHLTDVFCGFVFDLSIPFTHFFKLCFKFRLKNLTSSAGHLRKHLEFLSPSFSTLQPAVSTSDGLTCSTWKCLTAWAKEHGL